MMTALRNAPIRCWPLLAAVGLAACGGGDGGGGTTPQNLTPASITFDQGGAVAGTVGTAIVGQISVTVRAANSAPVPRVSVTFAPSAGSVSSVTAQTDENGRAVAGTWTLGNQSGTQTLTASVSGLSAQLSATAAAGAPATLELVTALPSQVRVGVPVTPAPQVRAKDSFGNIVDRAGLTVTAALQSGAGTLGGAQSTTGANGVATFSTLTVEGAIAGGPRTIAFSMGSISVAAAPVTLEAGTAFALTLNNVPATARAGEAIAPSISVQLADQFGNAVSRPTTVTATLAEGTGTLTGATATSAANGQAVFSALSIGGLVGDRRLRFTADGRSIQSSLIALLAGNASQLRVTSQPTVVENSVPFPAPVVVRVTDDYGNAVPNAGIAVSATLTSGGGSLTAAPRQTDAVGTATFTTIRIVGVAGPRVLTFSATGLASAVSQTITLDAGPPRTVAFFQQPSPTIVAGVPLATQPAVQLADTSGNIVRRAGQVVRSTLLDAAGELFNDAAITDANGIARFSQLTFLPATAFPPATLRLRFSSGALATLTSLPLAIQSAPGSSAQGIAYGATAQRLHILNPGATLNLNTIPKDGVGNPLPGINVVFSSSDPGVASVSSAGAITGVSGGAAWVRAMVAGSPNVRDSVYVTVPRDATGPVVSTTQIAPIAMRAGVSAGFDVILDTRGTTVGAATILLGFPPELVNQISWQGSPGTIIGFDKGFNILRISVVSSGGMQGLISLARITLTSSAPESHVINREIVVTPLEVVDLNLQSLALRSTGVNIPIIP